MSTLMTQLGAEVARRIAAAISNHTHDNATTTTAGFMSAADKTKLDNIGDISDFQTAFTAAYSDSNS